MALDLPTQWRFDGFVIEPGTRRLWVDGGPAKIGARAFDLLVALVERRDRTVSKGEILDLVWPDSTVEDGNLYVHIFTLRKLLGPDVIVTIPGRGYQFVQAVDAGDAAAGSLSARKPQSRVSVVGAPPSSRGSLYGRDAELAEVSRLVAEHRLISIVGAAGIGKTSLARTLASNFQHSGNEVLLVELASVENPDLVVSSIARMLGCTLQPNLDQLTALAESTRERHLLLILDNCEHLTAVIRDLVNVLLKKSAGIRLLVTSQAPLRSPEEWVYRLGPLSVPAMGDVATALDHSAVALFVARAQAAENRFHLNAANVGAVVDICSSLDGVPLAIELAAARLPVLGIHGLRQALEERLQLLAGGPGGALPRHRALSAALEWSVGLLPSDERHVFDRLGVFVGGFSLELFFELLAAERISRWTALEHLSALIEKSLVEVDSGEPPRYRLLETTRAFAMQRLSDADALDQTRRKHVQALSAYLRSRDLSKSPLGRAAGIAPDLANLRSAVAWATGPHGDRTLAVELAAESSSVWHVLGLNGEGAALFKTVEPWVDDSIDVGVRAKLWLSRAKVYPTAARVAADYALKAADVFRSLGDDRELFDAMTNAAAQLYYAGDFLAAEAVLTEVRALVLPDWPRWTQVAIEVGFGAVKYWAGELSEARRRLHLALEMSRDDSDASQSELIEMMLVGCEVGLRNPDEALRYGRELLVRTERPVFGFNLVIIETFLSAALMQRGEVDAAEVRLRAALPKVKQALGSARTTLCYVAYLNALQERYANTACLLGAIDGLRVSGGAILAPPNRAAFEDAENLTIRALGIETVERLKAEGRALTEDQAIALGLSK
jgi:predicted ATPase/DNA-binding winged helix-turn-helix (wHTH) protein